MPLSANSLAATLVPLLREASDGYVAALGLPWDVHPIAAFASADGEVLATTDATTAASSQRIVRTMSDFFGGQWQPGDIAVLNDPDGGSGHPTQISAVAPIRLDGSSRDTPDAWAIIRADIPDFGGWELGGYSPQAIDRWAEAGRIVPVKVRLVGIARREALDTLILNSRTAAITLSSVTAMADAATAMAERFTDLGAFATALEDHQETARRADSATVETALAGLAEGRHTGRCAVGDLWDGVDGGVIGVTIERQAQALHVVFDDAPPIDSRPINSSAAMTEDTVSAAVVAALGLDDVKGGAVYAALRMDVPDGTRLGAAVPAAVGIARETTCRALFGAVLAAFAAGGISIDAESAWASYRDRRIGDILDPTTGKITQARAELIMAGEAARTESAA